MNNETTMTLKLDSKDVLSDLAGVLVTAGPPLWRVQTVRVLQLLGILSGFLGGADFMQLLVLMPPDAAKWLLVAGPTFAACSKPMILLIGDYMDDGVKNDSFKVGAFLLPFLALLCILGFSGCAGVSVVTPYGDFHSSKDGSVSYYPPTQPVRIPLHPTK